MMCKRDSTHAAVPAHGRRRTHLWLLAAAAASLIGGCQDPDDQNAFAPPPPPDVIVAHPVLREVTSYLTYTGTIEPSETVELRARVPGFLDKVNFQPGQRVAKGDLLFVIDKRQFETAVDQAKASIQALESALQGAENDARLARELADQKAGPEIDAVIKAAKRESIRGEFARAVAALDVGQLNLDY